MNEARLEELKKILNERRQNLERGSQENSDAQNFDTSNSNASNSDNSNLNVEENLKFQNSDFDDPLLIKILELRLETTTKIR